MGFCLQVFVNRWSIYEEDGTLARPPIEPPSGEVISNIKFFSSSHIVLLMKSGKVFVVVREEKRIKATIAVSFPSQTTIIDISSYTHRLVSSSGQLYELHISVDTRARWVADALPVARLEDGSGWSIEAHEDRPTSPPSRI